MFSVETIIGIEIFQWVVLPLLIFLARVTDVTIGTLRIITISKGYRKIAPMLGFIEVLIWALAFGVVMKNLTNPFYYLVYAGGFATGTWVGIILEEKLAMGTVAIRLITKLPAKKTVNILRNLNFNVTSVHAYGPEGKTNVIYIITKRHHLKTAIDIIQKDHPRSIFSVEDVRQISHGLLPTEERFSGNTKKTCELLKKPRKGK
ncbi:DUF2179 domain-containing protein [Patescibacteria group bacterium]|nr:DUF2179 domain-containing protein [Patescibacteria group bacterium]